MGDGSAARELEAKSHLRLVIIPGGGLYHIGEQVVDQRRRGCSHRHREPRPHAISISLLYYSRGDADFGNLPIRVGAVFLFASF